MKIVLSMILLLSFYSCSNNVTNSELLKYSETDLKPLNDSTKALYYNDASFIELGQIVKDSIKKVNQIELDEDAILSYYEDLLYIYNNSYKLSNSFFEKGSSIHSHGANTLYQITVSIDTNKSWAGNWKNGIKITGIDEIDAIINSYNLEPSFLFDSKNIYWYEIQSRRPINYFSLMEKFKNTSEFINVEPTVLIGGGSQISLTMDENYKYYKYTFGWGDCPSGCINYHYWEIKLKGKEIELIDEGGDSLNN